MLFTAGCGGVIKGRTILGWRYSDEWAVYGRGIIRGFRKHCQGIDHWCRLSNDYVESTPQGYYHFGLKGNALISPYSSPILTVMIAGR